MATAFGHEIGWEILKLLGVKDTYIVEAHINIVVGDIITIDIKRYATRENGELILTEDEKHIKTELKKYRLEEIKEEKCKE